VSLIQYKALFNAFPEVTFPISVLASVTNQELASYAWIFPNVVTNGHWWYSNTPTFIEHDLAARLEAVPRTKQIGYYSDMYKLEFALPKFAMYKRILAKVLAERYVEDRGWSEARAIELGKQLLRGNVETTFGFTGPKAGVLGVAKRTAELSSSSGVLDDYIPYAPPVPTSVAVAAAAAAVAEESLEDPATEIEATPIMLEASEEEVEIDVLEDIAPAADVSVTEADSPPAQEAASAGDSNVLNDPLSFLNNVKK